MCFLCLLYGILPQIYASCNLFELNVAFELFKKKLEKIQVCTKIFKTRINKKYVISNRNIVTVIYYNAFQNNVG